MTVSLPIARYVRARVDGWRVDVPVLYCGHRGPAVGPGNWRWLPLGAPVACAECSARLAAG